ncbi:MAG: CBS domain-containing protein [Deltaproteobacteria bacterium]|nr:MAG: CBS domain-containing protein [Deltaproteobacteria bacterium]
MKVSEWMIKEPITVTKDQKVQDCVDLMKEYSIRHLPVVENQKLIGLVTESDLREVFLASLVEDLTIEGIMINEPMTVTPDTEIEDAAKLIYYHKIGGLPVVDDYEQVVGIITVADLVEAFIELMGVLKSSSRIDVILGDEPEAFERVSGLIRSEGGEIISVGISGHRLRRKRIYFFRLKKCNVKNIATTLQKAGFQVVSSTA